MSVETSLPFLNCFVPAEAPIGGPFVFACPKCPFLTLLAHRLRQHAFQEHGGKMTYQLYVCSVCSVTSTEHDLVRQHIEAAHPGSVILAHNIRLQSLPGPTIDCNPLTAAPFIAAGAGGSHGLTIGSTTPNSRPTMGTTGRTTLTAYEPDVRNTPPSHNWHELIVRNDKKFLCLICDLLYPGRTEAVFHTATKHLMQVPIERDLSNLGKLSEDTRSEVRRLFTEGMRIRSGVHYKNADMVEAALYLSIELHLRRVTDPMGGQDRYRCSQCRTEFGELAAAVLHVNEKLRGYLPDFMRSRSCPWSLHTRDEWVWIVPDNPEELPAIVPVETEEPQAAMDDPDDVQVDPMEFEYSVEAEVDEEQFFGQTNKDTDIKREMENASEPPSLSEALMDPEVMAEKEAMLETICVINSSQGYRCSACEGLYYACERLTKVHIVETHLNVFVALCPFCEHKSDQRGIKQHCSREHRDLQYSYITNPAFHELIHRVRVVNE